ncbi:MAG: hypothetical protein LBH58_07050, partial [Tannerellaceae bacterium]|nr:hypothetical protein [Tannerellaceae bacterium]
MTKEKKIKSDVFLCDVHILVTDNPDKCVDDRNLRIYCSDSPDEDLSKNCAGFVFQKRISDYYVVIPANVKYSVITHESVHLIGRIFRDR